MSEFEFKQPDWEHPIVIVAENREIAQDRFDILCGKKAEN